MDGISLQYVKKSAKIAIIAGICVVAIIGGLALYVDSKLSQIEKNETGPESAEQIAKETAEVLSGKAHSEADETNEAAETGNESTEPQTTEPSVNATDSELEESEANESKEHTNESP